MKKTCEFCETYWRVRNERKYDHPCIHRDTEEVCSDFKITWTRDACLNKYPRIAAHLICESLGYFTPQSAAVAISCYKINQEFCCEWYSHMAQFDEQNPTKNLFDKPSVLRVGRRVMRAAFVNRHRHHGYMSSIEQAKRLVVREIKDPGASTGMLASWF